MTVVADLLFYTAALAYLAASGLFMGQLFGRGVDGKRAAWGPRFVALGAALHSVHILVISYLFHLCPVGGIHFALSVVSVLAAVLYLAVRPWFHIDIVGAFVAPLALTFFLASHFVAGGGALSADPSSRVRSVLLPVHVLANLVGLALFLLAFGAAALYLLQERQLKKKHLAGLFRRLPPLGALDEAEHRFLIAGFPLLTIGILTGTFWAKHVERGSPTDVWRAVFSYLSWMFFAAVLLLRAAAGWRGRKAAYGTMLGFGFALLVLVIYLARTSTMVVAGMGRT